MANAFAVNTNKIIDTKCSDSRKRNMLFNLMINKNKATGRFEKRHPSCLALKSR